MGTFGELGEPPLDPCTLLFTVGCYWRLFGGKGNEALAEAGQSALSSI